MKRNRTQGRPDGTPPHSANIRPITLTLIYTGSGWSFIHARA